MRSLKLSERLWLTETKIATKSKAVSRKKKSYNHIWIYDRSGSMHYLLEQLSRDLVSHAEMLDVGDTLSLAWFSGNGYFDFMLKGYKITDPATDFENIRKIVFKNRTSLNTTCFSEVLHETSTVIKDLYVLNPDFKFMFFTDGYPVVRDYAKEYADIFSALAAVRGKVTSAIFVGYGDYYNKKLLAEMADTIGGSVIHSSSLDEFNPPMGEFVGANIAPRTAVFSMFGQSVVLSSFCVTPYEVIVLPMQDGQVLVYDDTDVFYQLVSVEPMTADKMTVQDAIGAVYASAMILSQQMRANDALTVLGHTGDKMLIDAIVNAFTNVEYGYAESLLLHAAISESGRYVQGQRKNYVPPSDAFCLVDALDIMMEDDECYFYPYRKEFSYKRIGVASKTKEGYGQFTPESNPRSPFNSITWNDTRLNLSIGARISGTVNLDKDCEKYGFSSEYPTAIYRNYTLVKDGILNVTKLPVSLSEITFTILRNHRMIARDEKWEQGRVYVLNLKAVPIMNRDMADNAMTAVEYCSTLKEIIKLGSALKVFKYIREELDPSGSRLEDSVTQEQMEYLESQGIKNGIFSPPVEKEEPTDWYIATEFDVKASGYSSIPPVLKVKEKLDKGTSLTPSEQLVADAIQEYRHSVDVKAPLKVLLQWLDYKISDLKAVQRSLRSDLQKTKFAILLGKSWFRDLTTRDGAVVDVDGTTFKFTIRDIKVEY